jgi:signal transduction histidine kinase
MNITTQTKTSLLLLGSFLGIILMFSAFVYLSELRYPYEEFYKLLEIRATLFAKTELEDKLNKGVADLREEFFEKIPAEQDYYIAIKPDKDYTQEAQAIGVPSEFFEQVIKTGKARFNNDELFFKGIRYASSSNGDFVVIASASNYFEFSHNAYLKRTLYLAIALAFVFAFFISLYLSKYIFKPLRGITERVKQISSENLKLRLNSRNQSDELRELVSTFNDMLDRIETSFETQNNFISNASHELRTPLTAIIGEADVSLSKIRKPDEYIETIKIILDEAEKLDLKTKALLFLAQTGFKGKAMRFDMVRIDQLLMDVKETIEKLNSKNKVLLDMSLLPQNPAKLKVKGNEQLLHLALSNIINNACKYSDYQIVNVSIGASDNKVIIVVKDVGIGIPNSELKYIYDPFFRASNTKNYEGYGIGLPLTNNIIRMHNGEILVSSILNKGTTVQINIPIGNYDV